MAGCRRAPEMSVIRQQDEMLELAETGQDHDLPPNCQGAVAIIIRNAEANLEPGNDGRRLRANSSGTSVPSCSRLAAGGRRIRTIGPAKAAIAARVTAFRIFAELAQRSASGHFDPFPSPRLNGRCP